MDALHFAEIQAEFMRRVGGAVYCSMATVDDKGRPRLRIMHPVWEAATGWVISWPLSHKAKHLARNPHVALAYIHDKDRPVYVDGAATWIVDRDEKLRVWALHRATPPPLGFDPEPYYGSIDHPHFGLLRITPRRIELANLGGEPVIWRSSA